MVLDLAEPRPGEAILDVGCGTGTLAIAAKRRIGESGRAVGVDPSVHLLAGARRKAARRSLPIEFQLAGIERLALPDHSFDAAFGTFMTHHVPHDLLPHGLTELGRVLKPGGRVVLVDFTRPDHPVHPGPLSGLTTGIQDLPPLLKAAGFAQIESGQMPFRLRGLSKAHPPTAMPRGAGPPEPALARRQAASRSRRRPLRPTMTVEPSWPGDAQRQRQVPSRSQMTRPVMKVAAMTRFCDDQAAGAAGERDHGGDGGEFVADDDRVGGLQGEVGAGPAHGDAGVGGGQRGGVVDAVADDQHPAPVAFQLAHRRRPCPAAAGRRARR